MGPSVAAAHAPASADEHSGRQESALRATSDHQPVNTESREWGVPPFEPLSIRTADFEPVAIIDPPMMADSDPLDVTLNLNYVEHDSVYVEHDGVARAPAPPAPDATVGGLAARTPGATADDSAARAPGAAVDRLAPRIADAAVDDSAPRTPGAAVDRPAPRTPEAVTARASPPRGGVVAAIPEGPPPEHSGRFTAVTPQAPNVSEAQRIVTVRVCAAGESRWAGTELLAALEKHGLGYGRYKVFHRKHSDGRTLLCAASLVEPGTFDITRMPEEEFRGLTLFAVLPGPAEPLQTIDTLIATAAELAETLHGTVQDSKGAPLSAERAEALREDVARFQATLTMT
jgi:ZipA, C-terminal FtsZ-binding domain